MTSSEKGAVGTNSPDRLPPGQTLTEKWPILTYGKTQTIEKADFRFQVVGMVERELTLTFDDLLAFPRTILTADFHCVTGWSRYDNAWEGVLVRDVLREAGLTSDATHAMAYTYGNYTTNLSLQTLLDDDVLLAFRHDGDDLDPDHGGPLRLVVPKIYAYKSAKWVRGFEVLAADEPGFWERGGYHWTGDPWQEQRFGRPFFP